MISRRNVLAFSAAIFAVASIVPASAFSFQSYDKSTVEKAIKSGAPVVVHVYAPWCLQCRAQASILSELAGDKQLDRVKFFRVDYDGQKDVVDGLAAPRSTLIAYKGGKEVARMSWGTSQEDVMRVLQAAS
jgi:thiol-disulfide isomerase/thioredoxin